MAHEKETLTAVIAARNEAITSAKNAAAHPDDAQAIQKAAANEAILNGSVSRFLALAEQYPDLKANQTMSQLMEELASTENKVAFARQAFNDAVMAYNTAREQFPNSLVAGFGHFPPAQSFEVDSAEIKSVPKVSF
ncbi:MAG TPA: LemA family protein, partial [Pseudomonadales bacterium]|nr:LemA family protein [Pseudomonadales bacterium]